MSFGIKFSVLLGHKTFLVNSILLYTSPSLINHVSFDSPSFTDYKFFVSLSRRRLKVQNFHKNVRIVAKKEKMMI